MSLKRAPGRQPKPPYITSWGETLEGAYLGTDGRLRPIGRSSPAFGPASDERLAVNRYKRWRAEQSGDLGIPQEIIAAVPERLEFYRKHTPKSMRSALLRREAIAEWARREEKERLRNLLLSDPKQAAAEFQIPHLANHPPTPASPQFTLEELGDEFLGNRRNFRGQALNKKHKENTKRAWVDFCTKVGVSYAREITQDLVQEYRKSIMDEFDGGKSSSWVRTRFVAVKAILRYGFEYTRDKSDYRVALDECVILKPPHGDVDPKPISPRHFRALLERAGSREKAMLLLGANTCAHGGEVCAYRKGEVSLSDRTLASRRSKNGYPRVAQLWRRTVTALQEYQKAHPHDSEYLFVTETGNPQTSEGLRQRIVALRKKKGFPELPASVVFDGIRDAAFSFAQEADAHHANFVAGHKTGESDKYVLRQTKNKKVIDCCSAIEKGFFDM